MDNPGIFPPLYNLTKSGKVKKWVIKVEAKGEYSLILTETGYIPDGKMTNFESIVSKGKNIGRSNETTHYEQALSEAKSTWNKKKDQQGLSETYDGIEAKDTPILPMLCVKYEDRHKDINFPCFVQPKIDGIRGIYQKLGGKWGMYSRLGNIFPHLQGVIKELEGTNLILDGELYSDKLTFQELNGLVRKKKVNAIDIKNLESVKYIVFDTVSPKDFKDRYQDLKDFFKENDFKLIELHKTEVCKEDSLIKDIHDEYVRDGYEGIIIRNELGSYIEKYRSKNILKYKVFQDEEFLITGFTEGEGTEAKAIVWECQTKEGEPFTVRPAGSIAERKKLFKNGEKYVGLLLTVKFFEYSDEGVPRFPGTIHGGLADIRNLGGEMI